MAHDFAPPTEHPPSYAAPPAGGPSGARASFGRRLGAALLDGLVLGLPLGVLAAALPDEAELVNALSFFVGVVYYVLLEGGRSGATLGKQALGIRVADLQDGGPIGYGRAVVRYVGRILSTIPLLLGYFWMLWDREKQTWHDKLARCVVVPVERGR
jgi:uncharacterized RDD family membrane protein YckC